jgi:DNA-binding NarL/FixJ family response regulator
MAILIVDEAVLTRDCLVQYLQVSAPDFVVKAVGRSVDADAEYNPAAVVVNAKTYGFQDQVLSDESASVQALWPSVPRLMISEQPAPPSAAFEAIRRGWHGYFPADQGMELLIAAIRLIALGGMFIPAAAVTHCVSRLQNDGP